jgi:ribonuclease P protein component
MWLFFTKKALKLLGRCCNHPHKKIYDKKEGIMKKISTLKKNYEFRYVLSKGKYYQGKFITIYIKKNNLNKNIIGIAINTKLGKAVKRNNAKRLIRENYRLIKDKLLLGNSIVFLWNKNVELEKADFFEIKKEMNALFKKAEIIK